MYCSVLNSQLSYKGKPLIAMLLTLGLLNLHRLVALEMMFLRCKVSLPGKAGNADISFNGELHQCYLKEEGLMPWDDSCMPPLLSLS